jgi:hypothetical protein
VHVSFIFFISSHNTLLTPPLLLDKLPQNPLQALIPPRQQQHILDLDDTPLGVFGEGLEVERRVLDLGPHELGQAADELRGGVCVEGDGGGVDDAADGEPEGGF